MELLGTNSNPKLMTEHSAEFEKLLNQLNERNFTIINNSKSNYAFTFLSLPSSLNMKYLENYDKNELNNNMELTYEMIPDNQVMKNFKNMDY